MDERDIDTSSNSTLSEGELQLLYRVDERTERMDQRMDSVVEAAKSNADDIDDLQSDVKRNTTILNGLGVGLGGVLTWIASKLHAVF